MVIITEEMDRTISAKKLRLELSPHAIIATKNVPKVVSNPTKNIAKVIKKLRE